MRSFLPVGMGSSPLTRGKHQRRVLPADYRGLIPAHAGKTRSCSSNPPARGAHPRSRGENSSWDHSRTMFRGSSPLTRGKHALATVFATRRGLIPAHAGKTFFSALSAVLIWAHPRSRGENHPISPAAQARTGSSPLTRGKHRSSARRARSCGLIPAHAGKTVGRGRGRAERGAHPRSRGENCFIARVSRAFSGSSPLTRGKQGITSQLAANNGLIPAHAGKTTTVYRDGIKAAGSSPLTRGKRESLPEPCRARRLIPAHAGKTGGGE